MNLENIPIPTTIGKYGIEADVAIVFINDKGKNDICYLDHEILQFACMMQEKLNKHVKDREDSWKRTDNSCLVNGLEIEMRELRDALSIHAAYRSNASKLCIISEAADVANFAMFIGWKAWKELQDE